VSPASGAHLADGLLHGRLAVTPQPASCPAHAGHADVDAITLQAELVTQRREPGSFGAMAERAAGRPDKRRTTTSAQPL